MTISTGHTDSAGVPIKIGDTLVDEKGGEVMVFLRNHQARIAGSEIDKTNGHTCSLNLWMLMSPSVTIKH